MGFDEVLVLMLSPPRDEPALNSTSGKNCKLIAKKLKTISQTLPKQLPTDRSDSSSEIKESVHPLNLIDLTDTPLSRVDKRIIEYDNAGDWECGLDIQYTEDEVISILNLVSCLENKRRGFGGRSNDQCYREEREADKDNRLYEEALRGIELLERGRSKMLKRPKFM